MKICKEVTLLQSKSAKNGSMYKFVDTPVDGDITDSGERWLYCRSTNLPLNVAVKIWIDTGSSFIQIGAVDSKVKK